MNKEKYIEQVLSLLSCSKYEKQRIYDDLNSDIESALEQGESWEQIEARLGSYTQMAKELSDNMEIPLKESKKRHTRLFLYIGAIVICLILGVFAYLTLFHKEPDSNNKQVPLELSTIFKEEEAKSKILSIIDDLEQGKFDQVYDMASEDLKANLSQPELEEYYTSLHLGNRKEIEQEAYSEITQDGQAFAVGVLSIQYENQSMTYTISLDKNMQMSGIWFR